MNQKGFINIALTISVVVIAGTVGYFTLSRPATAPIVSRETNSSSDFSVSWKTFRSDTYGFEIKYPSVWVLRDGIRDYRPAELDNFYQFCGKVVTTPDGPIEPNNNFVGYCDGEFLKISVWKPTTEIKTIAADFTTLKLDKENKITIGGKPASEFIYSGLNQVSGGTHIWRLFVISTNNHAYSISGDSCTDAKADCNQVLSALNFIP